MLQQTWLAVQKLPSQVPQSIHERKWDILPLLANPLVFFYAGIIVFGVFAAKETTAIHSLNVEYLYLATLTPPFVYYVGKVRIHLINR